MDYNKILESMNYRLCKDNIIRDDKNHPKCNNQIFQHLIEKIQDGEELDSFEEKLYGASILSLAEIVLNNRMMKFQTPEIKEESRGNMYEAILTAVPKFFDRTKGSTAYSYAFRIGYTTCVHVLQRHNAEREFMEQIKEAYEEELALENAGHKVCTKNISD